MGDENVPAAGDAAFCTYDDFCKIRLRVAEVVAARLHPNADKLLVLEIRLGETTRQICAGIRGHYAPESLLGKRLVVVENLEPRKLRGELSEGMLLAAQNPADGRLTLLTTDDPAFPSGASIR